MMPLRNDVRSATALRVHLRLECGPVNDGFRIAFGRFDHAAVVALAAFFRAYLNEADGLPLRLKKLYGRIKVESEDVSQTERISFSFAARIASISLIYSSVSF